MNSWKICKDFVKMWIEILVISLSIPEIAFVVAYFIMKEPLSQEIEILTLAFSLLIILTRPIIIYNYYKKTKVSSLYLPFSVLSSEKAIPCSTGNRIDTKFGDSMVTND